MADYLDRDALLEKLEERFKQLCKANGAWDEYVKGFEDALDTVEYFDPADAVAAVRCKECVHHTDDITTNDIVWCGKHRSAHYCDFYCADGRKG